MFGMGGFPSGPGVMGKFNLSNFKNQFSAQSQPMSSFLQNFMQRARMRRLGAAQQTPAMPPQGMMGPGTDGGRYQGQGGGRIAAGMKKFGIPEGM